MLPRDGDEARAGTVRGDALARAASPVSGLRAERSADRPTGLRRAVGRFRDRLL